eukprot:16445116-Heterocapsa_arctica.AAC.1
MLHLKQISYRIFTSSSYVNHFGSAGRPTGRAHPCFGCAARGQRRPLRRASLMADAATVEQAAGTVFDDAHMEEELFSPSVEGSEAAPSPSPLSTSKAKKAMADESDVCTICLVNVRGKKQQFCNSPCAGDVKAAERDALRRSGGKQQKAKGEKAAQFEHGSDI